MCRAAGQDSYAGGGRIPIRFLLGDSDRRELLWGHPRPQGHLGSLVERTDRDEDARAVLLPRLVVASVVEPGAASGAHFDPPALPPAGARLATRRALLPPGRRPRG